MIVQTLLEYQKIDIEINKLERELLESEESQKYAKLKMLKRKLQEDLVKVDKASGEILKKSKELDDKVLKLSEELKEYEDITDMQDETEADYYINKITALMQEIESVNREIDKLNKEKDNLLKDAEKTVGMYNKCAGEITIAKANFEEKKAGYAPKVKPLQEKMKELEKDIDESIIEKYRNLRNSKTKFPLVVALNKENVCQGCFVEATGADVKIRETGLLVVECPSCGRLVYKTED
ncbi:MAG: hypothetical protein PUK83_04565 [Clostridia bacterium]|nr:hypothetical protein [Clostridia bacterium]MDY5264621.1 hypothetical protein [Eubacteriales bacterium]MDY5439455.1 hypothetical protein [Eubacteriales bacterium]